MILHVLRVNICVSTHGAALMKRTNAMECSNVMTGLMRWDAVRSRGYNLISFIMHDVVLKIDH